MIDLLTIPLMSVADRVRGGWPVGRHKVIGVVVTLLMGWLIAFNAGYSFHWTALVCMVGWYLGEKPGWGWAMARALHTHEWAEQHYNEPDFIHIGNAWWTLIVRGLVWGIPVALLAFYDAYYLIALSMGLCMPSAAWIARKKFNGNWGAMELLRGGLFGLLIFATGIYN